MARAKQGDTAAYGEIVSLHQSVAARAAYLVTGNAADAEEVTQDAFVKAYNALGRFRDDAPFRPWLLRIVTNEALNRLKAVKRRPTVELTEAADRPSGDTALSPEGAALAGEQRDMVRDALAKLRDDDRLVISYRYFLDLSEAEMADALGIARGTVKSRLSRALERLREVMNG